MSSAEGRYHSSRFAELVIDLTDILQRTSLNARRRGRVVRLLTRRRRKESPAAEAPIELPRLQIVHLLGLTAATALALAPFQMSVGADDVRRTAIISSAGGWMFYGFGGIASGVFLCVTTAIAYWRRRGYLHQLQPGHWLAFRGMANWALAVLAVSTLISYEQITPAATAVVFFPKLVVSGVFFICFLRLAAQPYYTKAWRFAFAMLAFAPLAAGIGPVVIGFAGVFPGRGLLWIAWPQVLAAVAQATALGWAMTGDLRSVGHAHWSHLFPVAVHLLTLTVTVGYFAIALLMM